MNQKNRKIIMAALVFVNLGFFDIAQVQAQYASPSPVRKCAYIYQGTYRSKQIPTQDVADCNSIETVRANLALTTDASIIASYTDQGLRSAWNITGRYAESEDFFYLAQNSARLECSRRNAVMGLPALQGMSEETFQVKNQFCQGTRAAGYYHQFDFRCLACQ